MKKTLSFALICAFANLAIAKTEIVVSYTYNWFDSLHKELKTQFEKENPDVKITLRPATQTYEEGASKLMREKIVKQLPDIAFVSFNYLLPLVDKNVPQVINDIFSQKEKDEDGYTNSMLRPATIDSKVYGIPFAASLPIVYFNLDLVKKSGYNKALPTTWNEVFELSKSINKIPNSHGMYFENYADNWLFMALIMSQGGDFIKNGKIGFDNDIGKWAFQTLFNMHKIANMPNFDSSSAKNSFMAGNLGVYIGTSATLTTFQKAIKDKFELKTTKFVGTKENGVLPVGGSIAILTTQNESKKDLAVKYLKFVTGKIGNSYVPQYTGYMSANKEALKTLKDFYEANPNQQAAPSQLSLMGAWPSYPGENALKISDVMHDKIDLILKGEREDYEAVLQEMIQNVNKLLP